VIHAITTCQLSRARPQRSSVHSSRLSYSLPLPPWLPRPQPSPNFPFGLAVAGRGESSREYKHHGAGAGENRLGVQVPVLRTGISIGPTVLSGGSGLVSGSTGVTGVGDRQSLRATGATANRQPRASG
jgi:hypothetical protein